MLRKEVRCGGFEMKLNEIKEKLEKSIIALAICDEEENPHNIAVQINRVKEKKIILTDNYMQKTKENIKSNPKVALVFWKGDEGFGIRGRAEYFEDGKFLDFVKSLPENKSFPAKGAIIIDVKEIRKL
jgi:uncharacterized protein